MTCPHQYKLSMDGSKRRWRCCDLRGGFLLKHWRCLVKAGKEGTCALRRRAAAEKVQA